MYLHQWLGVQAGWQEKITYKYEESIVYRYLIQPVHAAGAQEAGKK